MKLKPAVLPQPNTRFDRVPDGGVFRLDRDSTYWMRVQDIQDHGVTLNAVDLNKGQCIGVENHALVYHYPDAYFSPEG